MHQAYFVYKLTCAINSKIYIGASYDPKGRLRKHRFDARAVRCVPFTRRCESMAWTHSR